MWCCANRPNTWMHPTGAHRCTKPLAPRGPSTHAARTAPFAGMHEHHRECHGCRASGLPERQILAFSFNGYALGRRRHAGGEEGFSQVEGLQAIASATRGAQRSTRPIQEPRRWSPLLQSPRPPNFQTAATASRFSTKTGTSPRSVAEQPGGEFASADPTTRVQDAGLQERRIGAKISLVLRRRLQRLQRPASSDLSLHAPCVSRGGDEHVARGRCGRVRNSGAVASCIADSIM